VKHSHSSHISALPPNGQHYHDVAVMLAECVQMELLCCCRLMQGKHVERDMAAAVRCRQIICKSRQLASGVA
jgi:hypothetical protein